MKYLLRSVFLLVVIFCFILINLKAQRPESPEPEPEPQSTEPEPEPQSTEPEPETSPPKSDEDYRKIRDQNWYKFFWGKYEDLLKLEDESKRIFEANETLRLIETAIKDDDLLNSERTKELKFKLLKFGPEKVAIVQEREKKEQRLRKRKKEQALREKKDKEQAKKDRLSRATPGYKDIKFGMTIDDIKDLGVCYSWSMPNKPRSTATCYEIGGERRLFIFVGGNYFHQIQIDLGTYTFESFYKLSTTIGKKYKKVFSHVLDNGYALECFHENKIALRSGLIRSYIPPKGGNQASMGGHYIEETKTFIIYNDGPYETCTRFAPADVSSDDF